MINSHFNLQQDTDKEMKVRKRTKKELHGDKWDAASDEIQEIEAVIDYTEMMSCAESYVERYSAQIHQALGIPQD